jgi:hypothetical protein
MFASGLVREPKFKSSVHDHSHVDDERNEPPHDEQYGKPNEYVAPCRCSGRRRPFGIAPSRFQCAYDPHQADRETDGRDGSLVSIRIGGPQSRHQEAARDEKDLRAFG